MDHLNQSSCATNYLPVAISAPIISDSFLNLCSSWWWFQFVWSFSAIFRGRFPFGLIFFKGGGKPPPSFVFFQSLPIPIREEETHVTRFLASFIRRMFQAKNITQSGARCTHLGISSFKLTYPSPRVVVEDKFPVV